MKNHFTIPYLKFKSGASSVWNGILKALPLLTNGMRRLIRDGNDFLFWLDRWVDERPLSAYLLHELSFADLHKFVETTGLINGVGWNWLAFQTFLPSHIIERIKAVMIHDDADLEDSWFWSLTSDGEFSVHTAYNYLVSNFLLTRQCEWRQIWSLNIPSRVRSRLWLIKHQKIMCNAERKRMGVHFY